MTKEIFLNSHAHFVHYYKVLKNNKIFLLLNGHISHKSLGVLVYAKENDIVLFWFPAHCTHHAKHFRLDFLTNYKYILRSKDSGMAKTTSK